MHICLIMDNPETPRHPVIAVALQQLAVHHTVRLLDVRLLSGETSIMAEEQQPRADLYLLKSHAPQALELAHYLEEQGSHVVNNWASAVACQDRALMAERLRAAHLPWPETQFFPGLGALLADPQTLSTLCFPLIVKSHYSHRGDLVAKVDDLETLKALGSLWSQEPVVLQAFAAGDGWDIKLWVIGKQIFAARRRTPLEPNPSKQDFPLAPDELPEAWSHIVREIGRVFDMKLYGVDLLITTSGPIIVDVNAFPGFRGVPGADSALTELVEQLLAEEEIASTMKPTPPYDDEQTSNSKQPEQNITILDLPSIVSLLFERAQRPLLPGAQAPLRLFVRYLRRKPGRGLAVIYSVDELRQRPGHERHAPTTDPGRSVSLTLDEVALENAQIRFSANQVQQTAVEIQPSGVLRAMEVGLSVQVFPADGSLPMLAASCDTTSGSRLFAALEAAARLQLNDGVWRLLSARAIPVRYKPASRCVIRYTLSLASARDSSVRRDLVLFGKVYADPKQARTTQAMMLWLYEEQMTFQDTTLAGLTQRAPLLPRPLGTLDELGLTLNEAVLPADPEELLRTGTRALQPWFRRGHGGEITNIVVPEEELRLTAVALARLHTSEVRPDEMALRTGAKEAKRAQERAALIAAHNPSQAGVVRQLAQQLATRLSALTPDIHRPAHGGFKASQLLFHSHAAFVVDFDGFCLADPALDVGYFLAYLRPSGLWYRRAGMREWFEASATIFKETYQQALRELGMPESSDESILARSRLYEAALLFKIATRRVNRLNSPRPKELAAMLSEIAACLSHETRRG